MVSLRHAFFVLFVAVASLSAQADDILFIGNSFTYGETAPAVKKNGGVPKLFEEIALAKGRQVATAAVTAGGKDWAYHPSQPPTAKTLASKNWSWVVLQEYSTPPPQAGRAG